METENFILVAMTEDRLIGQNGSIPWHLPEELKLFRELTVGHTVVMGRKTFQSIGRPLPDRRNIVISRTLSSAEGAILCPDLTEALRETEIYGGKVFFIGGRQLYAETLPLSQFLRISWIPGKYEGSIYFPEFDLKDWIEVTATEYPQFRHVLYRRR